MAKFLVKREHIGDRPYAEGETRDAERTDVQHLIDGGVLEAVSSRSADKAADAKAAPKTANKMAPAAQNKS